MGLNGWMCPYQFNGGAKNIKAKLEAFKKYDKLCGTNLYKPVVAINKLKLELEGALPND